MIGTGLLASAATTAALALAGAFRARLVAGRDPLWAGAASGALLSLTVLLLDGGQVLRWRYGVLVNGARVELPGVGLMLGMTLLAALAGTLLSGVPLVAGSAPRPLSRSLGGRSLILAAGLGAITCGLMFRELLRLEGSPRPQRFEVWLLVGTVGLLIASVVAMLSETTAREPAPGEVRSAALWTGVTAILATVALVATGVESWSKSGAYLTPRTLAVLAAALVAFAAREDAAFPAPRRVLALAALLVALES